MKSYLEHGIERHWVLGPQCVFTNLPSLLRAVGKVKYYNRIDEELELPLDILDPLLSEFDLRGDQHPQALE